MGDLEVGVPGWGITLDGPKGGTGVVCSLVTGLDSSVTQGSWGRNIDVVLRSESRSFPRSLRRVEAPLVLTLKEQSQG